jgi:hypothetical protein
MYHFQGTVGTERRLVQGNHPSATRPPRRLRYEPMSLDDTIERETKRQRLGQTHGADSKPFDPSSLTFPEQEITKASSWSPNFFSPDFGLPSSASLDDNRVSNLFAPDHSHESPFSSFRQGGSVSFSPGTSPVDADGNSYASSSNDALSPFSFRSSIPDPLVPYQYPIFDARGLEESDVLSLSNVALNGSAYESEGKSIGVHWVL